MKKLVIALVVMMVSIAGASSVFAFPLPFEFKMKMQDLEFFNAGVVPGVGPFADGAEDNWGVASITQIFDLSLGPLAPAVWNEGDNGEHLRLAYWGLDIAVWPSDPGGFVTIPAGFTLGGVGIPYAGADLWLWDSDLPGYSPFVDSGTGTRVGFSGYPTISGSNAGLQTSLLFAPGIVPLPGVITSGATFGVGTPPTGHGAGYLDVIAGSGPISGLLDTNGFPTPFGGRDMFFEFDFSATTGGPGAFQLNSDDPILGSAVPEPTSIILLGLGMLGLAGWRKKKVV